MLKTFTWSVDMGPSAQTSHRVGKNQFGDGYAQKFKIGINNKTKNWSGTKKGDYRTVIKPIIDFLDEHEGYLPFLWTDPHGETRQYTCSDYPVVQTKANHWQITLNFEQNHSV